MSLLYNKKAYTLLKKCSDNRDMTEWNAYRKEENNLPINLRFSNLEFLYLVDADLRNVDLRGAELYRMKCNGANVENVNIGTKFYWIVYFVSIVFSILSIFGLFKLGLDGETIMKIVLPMLAVSLGIVIGIGINIGNFSVFNGVSGLIVGVIVSVSVGLGLGLGVIFGLGFVFDVSVVFSVRVGVFFGVIIGVIIGGILILKTLVSNFNSSVNRAIAHAINPEKAIGFNAKYLKDIRIPLSTRSDAEISIVKELISKEKDENEKQALEEKLEELQKEKEKNFINESKANSQQIKIQNALNHIIRPYQYIEKNISKLRKHNYFFYAVIVILLSVFVYALFEDYIGTRSSHFDEVLGKDSVSFGSIFGVILFYATPIFFGMSIIVYAINQINKNIQIMESMQEQRRSIEVLQSTLLAQTEIADGVSDSEIKALTQSLQKGALERMFGQDKTSQGSDKATSNYREKLLFNNLSKFLTQALKK